MWFFNVFFSLLSPAIHTSTVPTDSVSVQLTYEKTEPGKDSKKTYYYQLTAENKSNELVYIIVPKWFETKLYKEGIMREVDIDSHDGITEYSFYSNDSFEIFALYPHQKIVENNCKIRTTNVNLEKGSSAKLPVYIVHDIKIGELKFYEYVEDIKFFGSNLAYEVVDMSATEMTIALK